MMLTISLLNHVMSPMYLCICIRVFLCLTTASCLMGGGGMNGGAGPTKLDRFLATGALSFCLV